MDERVIICDINIIKKDDGDNNILVLLYDIIILIF